MPDLPPPDTARAWDDPRTRWAWWRHAGWCGRRLLAVAGVYLAVFLLVAVVAAVASGPLVDLVATLSVFVFLGGVPVLIGRLAGFIAALMIRRRLAGAPWRRYDCLVISVEEGALGAVRLTLRPPGGGVGHRVRFQAGKRRETFLGPGTHVWVAGDPAVRGVVVLAGGGQMFLFHRDRFWERAQARLAATPRTPRTVRTPTVRTPTVRAPKKVKPLSPKAQARVAAAAARDQARARSAAENRRQAQQRAVARQARIRAAKDMLPWRKRQGWNG